MRSSQETRFLLPVAALSAERRENRGTAKEKREKRASWSKGVMTRKVLVLVVTGRRVYAPLGVTEQGALSCKPKAIARPASASLDQPFGHAVHGAGSSAIQAYRAHDSLARSGRANDKLARSGGTLCGAARQ